MFSAPQADKARQIVAQAEPSIDRAIAAIQANQPFAPTRNNLYDRFMSGPVNPIFYKFFVKANAFTASSACIGCGQCVKRCPMNNVAIKDGKPVWGRNCTHCMACICYCPVSAIAVSYTHLRVQFCKLLLVKLLDGDLNGQKCVQKASILFSTILRDDACVLRLNEASLDQLGHIFSHGVRAHIDSISNRPVARMALICRPILNVHQVSAFAMA